MTNTPLPPEDLAEDVARLLDILSHRREHNSAGEAAFKTKYIDPLDFTRFYVDGKPQQDMAYLVEVPNADGSKSKVLWSCHIDTVHGGKAEQVKQQVMYDANLRAAYKDDKECLGADDGAGVWLLLNMIEAGVPGGYIFHRGEEKGCIGSKFMAKEFDDVLKAFDFAIAFDRKGSTDVITKQRGKRSCSDAFADAFASVLNTADASFRFLADPTGVYTDTAEYTDLIGECTNVSCGYEGAHTGGEMLDVDFLISLKNALIKAFKVTPDTMVATRQAGEDDPDYYDDEWGWTGYRSPYTSTRQTTSTKRATPLVSAKHLSFSDISDMSASELRDWVHNQSGKDIVTALMALADEFDSLDYEFQYVTAELERTQEDLELLQSQVDDAAK